MKKVINQKWILSAFLIAALGSQYYYSVSSQQILSADFASTAELPADEVIRLVTPTSTSETTVTPPPTPSPSTTQADAPQACNDCVTWVLTRDQARSLENAVTNWTNIVRAREAAQPAPAPTPSAPAPAAAPTASAPETLESICADEPTQASKQRCIRRERENERQEAEREAMDIRGQEFEDKMADYADRYPGNLETLSSRFQSLLRTYSGRKKIEPAVAQRVFARYIEPLLRARLNSAEQTPEGLQALQDTILNISSGLPNEYRSINNLIALDIRRSAETRAAQVRARLQEARQAYDSKDFATSQELWQTAEQDRRRLLVEYNGSPRDGISGYYDMLANNLKSSDEQSNANMIPAIRNLFTQMNNDSSNWLGTNFNTGSSSTTGTGSASGSRGGRGTVASPQATTSGAPSGIGPALPNQGNMTIGSPNSTMQGSRTGRN